MVIKWSLKTDYSQKTCTKYREGIEEGAKWMRDKMKGGEQ